MIIFKKLTNEDMPLFFEWAEKPHVKDTWFQEGYEPLDKYYKKIEGNGYDHGFIIYWNDAPIGYIQTSDLYAYRTRCKNPKGLFSHEEPGTFCLDLFIGEEEYLNKGHGIEIVKAFTQKLLNEFKAKKIVLDPACSNKQAIRCYEKAGFVVIRKEHDGTNECYGMKFMNNSIEVIKWNNKFEKQAIELLNKYDETSLFLLSNLKTYGTVLGEDTYSADFKCLVKEEKVVAVFALAKAGNLLLQTDRLHDYSSIIIGDCLKSTIPLKGVVADWDLAESIWNCAKRNLPILKETAYKKEILFRLGLDLLQTKKIAHDIRALNEADFPAFDALHVAFLKEQGLDNNEDIIAKKKRFKSETEMRHWMGAFINNKLVATAAYIARVDSVGLIGSVYTAPQARNQGIAKALVYQLLVDGKQNKKMKKVILFTHQDNHVAIRLYEDLGFKRIGYFGLLFGEYNESK